MRIAKNVECIDTSVKLILDKFDNLQVRFSRQDSPSSSHLDGNRGEETIHGGKNAMKDHYGFCNNKRNKRCLVKKVCSKFSYSYDMLNSTEFLNWVKFMEII